MVYCEEAKTVIIIVIIIIIIILIIMIIIMTMIMIMIIIIIILLRTSCYKRKYEDGHLIYICNYRFKIDKKLAIIIILNIRV